MRNDIVNCKDVIHLIYIDEKVWFSLNTNLCDPHQKHITTGHLRIIENKKLAKVLFKSPNYREPRSIYFNKAFIEIGQALKTCIEKISSKNKLQTQTLTHWK